MGLFSRKPTVDWGTVHRNATATLIAVYSSGPMQFATQYARLVLNSRSEVHFHGDERDPKFFLGWGDLTVIGLYEDRAALLAWAEGCEQLLGNIPALVGHTQPYVTTLVRALQERVNSQRP